MSQSTLNNQVTILNRALGADPAGIAEETARYFLSIQLDPSDEQRANELAEKAREGSLSPDEESEIDELRRVGRVIEMLKFRAQIALNQAG